MRRRLLQLAEFKRLAAAGEDVSDVLLRKAYTAEVAKEVDEGRPIYSFTISTDSVDRDSDVIAVEGWQLANYKRNPVVMWAHDYSEPPLGQASKIKNADGKLVSAVKFDSDISEFAKMIEAMVDRGTLRSASVGFRPMEHAYNDVRRGTDFKKQELLEWSIVPIPANPEALMEARGAGLDLAPLRDWAERVLDQIDPKSTANLVLTPKQIEAAWRASGGGKHTVVIVGGLGKLDDMGRPEGQSPTMGSPAECPRMGSGSCPNVNHTMPCPAGDCPMMGAADGRGPQPGNPADQPTPENSNTLALDDGELTTAELVESLTAAQAMDAVTEDDAKELVSAMTLAALGEMIPDAVRAAMNRHTGRVD